MGGIPPVSGPLVRPLLDVTRDEVEAFCRALGLRPRRDPMNEDTALLRNAIRLEAIPAIERATGREVRDTFARTAGLLREDADTLWQQATELAGRHGRGLLDGAASARSRSVPMRSRPDAADGLAGGAPRLPDGRPALERGGHRRCASIWPRAARSQP